MNIEDGPAYRLALIAAPIYAAMLHDADNADTPDKDIRREAIFKAVLLFDTSEQFTDQPLTSES